MRPQFKNKAEARAATACHEERASYLDANHYVHTNMDEEEHRAEAARITALLHTLPE